MSKTGLLAALFIVASASAGMAQTTPKVDQSALAAKKSACQAEAKAKKISDKAQRKTFMTECVKR